jgi:hypothetical protein
MADCRFVKDGHVEHHIVWHCAQLASSEHACLRDDEVTYRLHGTVVIARNGVPSHITYEVVVDRDWFPRTAIATVTTTTTVSRIALRSVRAGKWTLDRTEAPT